MAAEVTIYSLFALNLISKDESLDERKLHRDLRELGLQAVDLKGREGGLVFEKSKVSLPSD